MLGKMAWHRHAQHRNFIPPFILTGVPGTVDPQAADEEQDDDDKEEEEEAEAPGPPQKRQRRNDALLDKIFEDSDGACLRDSTLGGRLEKDLDDVVGNSAPSEPAATPVRLLTLTLMLIILVYLREMHPSRA